MKVENCAHGPPDGGRKPITLVSVNMALLTQSQTYHPRVYKHGPPDGVTLIEIIRYRVWNSAILASGSGCDYIAKLQYPAPHRPKMRIAELQYPAPYRPNRPKMRIAKLQYPAPYRRGAFANVICSMSRDRALENMPLSVPLLKNLASPTRVSPNFRLS